MAPPDPVNDGNQQPTVPAAVAYAFSAVAFAIFLYTFFGVEEVALREQAIVWFFAAFAAAVLPRIKQFRYGDLEVKLQDYVQQQIRTSEELALEHERMKAGDVPAAGKPAPAGSESAAPPAPVPAPAPATRAAATPYASTAVYSDFARRLETLSGERKLGWQERFTRSWLERLRITLPELKRRLRALGFFTGAEDDEFTADVAQAIADFQKSAGLLADGIFGGDSMSALRRREAGQGD